MADRQYGTIEGDPNTLAKKARKYQEIADAIQRSTGTLDNIANQIEQKSLAMEKTRSLARDVADDISKALDRYRTTGDALAEYEPALRQAQVDGNPQVAHIARLQVGLSSAQNAEGAAHRNAEWAASSPSSHPDDVADAKRAAHRATQERQQLQDELATAQKIWDDAETSKNQAAEQARGKIVDVVSGSRVHGLKDSTWDKITFYAGKAYEIFKVICDVAGVLSIFLAWVPGLGEVLLALAAIGAILSVVEAAVNVATGKGSWGDLLLATGMAVLTVFGGKLLTLGADFVKAKGVATAVEDLGRAAAKTRLGDEVVSKGLVTARVGGKRALLKTLSSPLTRSSSQAKLMREFESSTSKWSTAWTNVGKSAKEAFPANPFKDGAARWMLGNDDVASLVKFGTGPAGTFLSTAQQLATAGLTVGSYANRTYSLFKAGAGVYAAGTGGDVFGVATGVAGIAVRPMNGSYGDMVSGVSDGGNLVQIIDSMV